MAYENLLVTIKDGIQYNTINREKKMNALNAATMQEIKQAMHDAISNPEVRGVIFQGAGEKAFVAGADISEFLELDKDHVSDFAKSGQDIMTIIENCPKPTIAVVQGFALGGGCELAMSCHMRIATPKARFGQPEVNLGLIPGYGGTQRMAHLLGKAKAFEFCMTADLIGAEDALRLGLVNYIEEDQAQALAKAESLLQKIFTKAPIAISKVIACVNDAINKPDQGYQTEYKAFGSLFETADLQEGVTAFLEKRKADFKGK